MSVNIILWATAIGACSGLVLQWFVLRSRYLRGMAEQRSRHQHQQQMTQQHLEQAKQQIGQLQHALTVARMQVKRQLAQQEPMAQAPAQRTRAETPSRPALPTDGFASFIAAMRVRGISDADLDLMTRRNPARLLGLP